MALEFELSAKNMGLLLDDPGLSKELRDALELATPFQKDDYGVPRDFYMLEVSKALAAETHNHAKRLRLSAVERDVQIALDGATREERG